MSHTQLRERIELFVLRVVRLVDALPERELFAEQKTGLLRSATSVGSRFMLACSAEIPEEYLRRLQPVRSHLDECRYWLDLLVASRMADPQRAEELKNEAGELLAETEAPEVPEPASKPAPAIAETSEETAPDSEEPDAVDEGGHGRIRVLLATDVPSDAGRVIDALRHAPGDFSVELVATLAEAIETLSDESFDVALVEFSLSDAQGSEVVDTIRQEAPALPLILLASEAQARAAEDAVRRGAQDHFVKRRLQPDSLARSIRFAIRLKQSEFLARHDSLTGLPNRVFLEERLAAAVAQARRSGDSAAVLFLDLDKFKEINDELGHEVGDQLLRSVARRLSFAIRETDTVARLGGDEFLIVLTNLESPFDVTRVAEKIVANIGRTHQVETHRITVQPSIGISIFPDDSQESDELVRLADAAMYESKKQGGNQFHFADSEMDVEVFRQRSLRSELHQALNKGELRLYYQPQLNLKKESVSSVEALLRWEHPERGLLTPADFLPTPQDPRFMSELLEFVLQRAYGEWNSWPTGGEGSDLSFSVNLHNHRLNPTPLLESTMSVLRRIEFDPAHLIVEVTEAALFSYFKEASSPISRLTEMGVRLAIDDFGSGHFSLADLAQLPIHSLKLPQGLTQQIGIDREQTRMAETIVALAHELTLVVVGKGVETAEQYDRLLERHCDEIQGFYFARPMAQDRLLEFFERLNSLRPRH